MKQISYVLKEEVPLVAETEILVIGSGPGGLCAAVTAARRGRQVIMAEHYGSPGGMANVGEISPFMPNHCSGECLDRPLYVEWLNRMRAYRSLPAIANRHSEWDGRTVSRYGAMLAAEDMRIFPLYHPASVLYNPRLKEVYEQDLRALRALQDGN